MNDIVIQGLSIDSRKVKPGDLFIALKGNHCDGQAFISDAIEKGAVAVLSEKKEIIRHSGPSAALGVNSGGNPFPIIPFSH